MTYWIPMLTMAALPSPAAADPAFDRAVAAVEERLRAIDTVPDVIPGRAVVMVKAGDAPVINVRGTTRIEGGKPIGPDTPMYIASMTKAFVGLMAVRLDEEGVMPLNTRLGDVFPEMRIKGTDIAKLTMRELLSHQLGFRARALNMRTAYTDRLPVSDYPGIVNASGEATKPGFAYDNLGYLLYAAALEKKTSKSWRRWIDEMVFTPLGMKRSSARTSDFATVSHSHERYEDGWRIYAAKPDSLMHAAGGLVVSPADMARWLTANVGVASAIPKTTFEQAHEVQAKAEQKRGPVQCFGYAFGWNRCHVFGLTFFEHGGGYTGMRSQMMIIPDRGVGFAAMFNSDSMTGGLSGKLMQVFVSAYANQVEGMPSAEEMKQRYIADTSEFRANRTAEDKARKSDLKWGGWTWRPNRRELAALAGAYRHPAFGTLVLNGGRGTLRAALNGMAVDLRPARKDLFGATLKSSGELEELKVVRDATGKVTAVDYAGILFGAGAAR